MVDGFPAEGMELTQSAGGERRGAVGDREPRGDHSGPGLPSRVRDLRSRGAEFLTPPVESDWEVRGFFRDPDGHLLEISEAKSGA
jgi:catechol 2,3-dioxygenase-like lactoylglutathione lyase family enzyme